MLPEDAVAPGRAGGKCDPLLPLPVALPYNKPASCTAPAVTPGRLPDGLRVGNAEYTAYCPTAVGYSVTGTTGFTVAAQSQIQTVLFTTLPNINTNQLNYLADIVPSASASIIANALAGNTADIANVTHLTATQVTELVAEVQASRFVVDSIAVELARNNLLCRVPNTPQGATCPADAYFGATSEFTEAFYYVPAATAFSASILVDINLLSTTGDQSEFTSINLPSITAAAAIADALALTDAQSQLRCIYGNDYTTAACCTAESENNLGYMHCVPATGPTLLGIPIAVGFYDVAANTVFSSVNKNEANSSAVGIALSSLNCYYPNDEIIKSCTAYPGYDYDENAVTTVTLAAGTVILSGLTASVTGANAQAEILAEDELNCYWSNDYVVAYCPSSGEFTAINNILYDIPASSTVSSNYSSGVATGAVISYAGKTAANDSALDQAASSLSCVYCNEPIFKTCTGGVNESIGITGDIVCNVLAEVAQNTAISIASILTSSSGGDNCCYGNDEMYNGATCDPTNLVVQLSKDSFYIAANTFSLCPADAGPYPGSTASLKQQANQLALELANSFVTCFYYNDYKLGATCATGDIMVVQGYANVAEFIAESLTAANQRAQYAADARTVCIDPEDLGGAGCSSTILEPATSDPIKHNQTLNITWNAVDCTFTPTMTVAGTSTTKVIKRALATMKSITICNSAGENENILVPAFGSFEEDADVSILIDEDTDGGSVWFSAVEDT